MNEKSLKKQSEQDRIKGKFMRRHIGFILHFFIIITIVQCYQITSTIRIYNLNNSEKIEIEFNDALAMHGEVSYIAENGETFEGEYLFQGTSQQNRDYRDKYLYSEKLFNDDKKAKESFAKLYGFSEKANAKPIGTMVLVGNFGTVIDLVFYTFSYDKGTASGIGKDNKGNVYRIYTTNYYN